MAINLSVSHADTPYRVKYYAHKYFSDSTALKSTDKVKGLFYAKKMDGATKTSYMTRDNAKVKKVELTIFTRDFVDDLEQDDFLLFAGEKWIIKTIVSEDLTDHKSNNIFQGTTIQIRR